MGTGGPHQALIVFTIIRLIITLPLLKILRWLPSTCRTKIEDLSSQELAVTESCDRTSRYSLLFYPWIQQECAAGTVLGARDSAVTQTGKRLSAFPELTLLQPSPGRCRPWYIPRPSQMLFPLLQGFLHPRDFYCPLRPPQTTA